MKLLKFGGTSVGSAENIRKVIKIIKDYQEQKVAVAVVISAMKGITNQLIEAGEEAAGSDENYIQKLKVLESIHVATVKELIHVQAHSQILARLKMIINELEDLLHGIFLLKEISPRTLDLVQSFGERLSAYILSEYLQQENIDAEYLDARELIKTDTTFGNARPNFTTTNTNIVNYFRTHKSLQVITGFTGSSEKGHTTTLGRGGSDYTAAIFGAALDAEEIEIWTDVDGVMTADPKIVKDAFSLPAISYIEAMELSHFGAKVIYPPTLQPAFSKKIPLRIRNTFNPSFAGTYISEYSDYKSLLIKGISSISNISLISVSGSGMVGIPGFAAKLFNALARANINIILITQASSEHSICFAVSPSQALSAKQQIEEEFEREISLKKVDRIKIENDLSILAIVGENMKNTFGIAGKLFATFAKNGINVSAMAQGSSELNLSVAIKNIDLSKALNAVHQAFFLSNIRRLNLFIVGTGLIGNTLLKQIQRQMQYLLKDRLLQINVIALANSRNVYFNKEGIDLNNWKEKVDFPGKNTKMEDFVTRMKSLNLPNSVFVDCTSSNEVIKYYKDILKASISIVTPNKLANSNSYADYDELQKTAFKNGVRFLYETNVGAGLPVINTLKDLKFSGDKILKIEGVLSGTLSYIFNNFDGKRPFSSVVKEAKEKGYTEPDPRDDLNGMDVARKILILAREAGVELEPDEVQNKIILPEQCMNAKNVDEFFSALEMADPEFDALIQQTKRNGQVLRFIASAEDGRASLSLQSVDQDHPFYSLSGSDNIISFTTERYKERPLVIKGPGAGAEVTAAGVFAEIISIGNYMA